MRSAFAHQFWLQELSKAAMVSCISAGTSATKGRGAHPDAIEAALALSVPLNSHRSSALAETPLSAGDLLVGFDCENFIRLRTESGRVPGVGALMLGDLGIEAGTLEAEITDPWGTGSDNTLQTFARIQDLLKLLAEQLASASRSSAAERSSLESDQPGGS